MTLQQVTYDVASSLGTGHGACRLSVVSSTQIMLSPFGGNLLQINGALYQIPSSGITANTTGTYVNGVAGQNLTANTTYDVFVFNNSGTLTLDFVTTGHMTDTTAGNIGIEVRNNSGSPDSTRTLVGKVAVGGSTNFQDNSGVRWCLNWFNRRMITAYAEPGSPVTGFTAAPWAEITSNFRIYFLTWGDGVYLSHSQMVYAPSASSWQAYASISLDSTSSDTYALSASGQPAANYFVQIGGSAVGLLSEGSHYTTITGGQAGSVSLTYDNGGYGWNNAVVTG